MAAAKRCIESVSKEFSLPIKVVREIVKKLSLYDTSEFQSVVIDTPTRREILEYLSTGREIVSILQRDTLGECPIISAEIGDLLGSGVEGSVYTIKTTLGNTLRYVVKVTHSSLFTSSEAVSDKDTTIDKLAISRRKMRGVPYGIFLKANDGDRIVRKGEKFVDVVPIVLDGYDPRVGYICRTERDEPVRKFEFAWDPDAKDILYYEVDMPDVFVYPKGSYLCDDGSYTEYILGLLCSTLVERGECINFLHQFSFAMCQSPLGGHSSLRNFSFSERADGDLSSLEGKATKDTVTSIYLQTLFAISIMNRKLGVQHNDLHLQNVMYSRVPAGGYSFGKERITPDVQYVRYIIDGQSIYVPFNGYIVKIADLGHSVKFSKPMVGKKTFTTGFNKERYDMPAWRDDSYDAVYFTVAMLYGFGDTSECVVEAMQSILGTNIKGSMYFIRERLYQLDVWKEMIMEDEHRVGRQTLQPSNVRPWELLLSSSFVKRSIPKGSKFVTFGVLEGYYGGYDLTHTVRMPGLLNSDSTIPKLRKEERSFEIEKYTDNSLFEKRNEALKKIGLILTDKCKDLSVFYKVYLTTASILDRYLQRSGSIDDQLLIPSCVDIALESLYPLTYHTADLVTEERKRRKIKTTLHKARSKVLDTISYYVIAPVATDYIETLGGVVSYHKEEIGETLIKASLNPKTYFLPQSLVAAATIYTILAKERGNKSNYFGHSRKEVERVEKYLVNM